MRTRDRLAGAVVVLMLAGCGRPEPTAAAAPSTVAQPAADQPAEPVPPATAPVAVPPSAGDPLAQARMDGYGDLRLGMPAAGMPAAWGGELKGTADSADGCHLLTPAWSKGVPELAFMVEGGRFVRYDVRGAKETAPGGGRVGASEAELQQLYAGRIEVQPHKYGDGHVLRVADRQAGTALLFETDAAGTVTRWRVGLPPQVDYVESCG